MTNHAEEDTRRHSDEPVAGAFAMLDILGFKERLRSLALPELRDKVVGALVTSAAAAQQIVNGDRERAARWGRTDFADLDWAYFSDSIVLWLPNGDGDARLTMTSMIFACEILVAQAMWLNLPLRGAIAYGECAFSRDPIYYVGKPIIEAYELEQAQDWAGVALCESAKAHALSNDPRIVTWRVPVKGAVGSVNEMAVVDWPWACQPTPDWENCFLQSTEPSVVRKRKHTTEFFEERRRVGPGRGGAVFGPYQDATHWRELYEDSRGR